MTWDAYGQDLEENLQELLARVHSGAYRASPSRRAYIPKADGRQRPLGIATLEDKILQRAVVEVLNAIYEVDFLGFSYGFRPGRSPHDALDALTVGIERKKVNWVLDADINEFFTSLDHDWLTRFLEHRIADKRVLRLIHKWVNAGVIEDGEWTASETGAPQGASASPLLANIYLHYVLDRWVRQWRQRHAHGDVVIVRFADDFVAGFEHKSDAEQFLADLRERFAKFALELHPDKTRLIEFGRYAARNRAARGDGKPETFDFLGFTHICGKTKNGQFWLRRKTISKRMRAKLTEVKDQIKQRRHLPHPRTREVARLSGARTPRLLRRARQHRRRGGLPHAGDPALVQGAPAPQPAHPGQLEADEPLRQAVDTPGPCAASLPERALRRSHPRQEPSAVVAHAGICAGGRESAGINRHGGGDEKALHRRSSDPR